MGKTVMDEVDEARGEMPPLPKPVINQSIN
jgi:hypothetical protein